jgi:two-component system invasion response regulator UvrY
VIRVMLVDDHALVRVGFRMLLADQQVEVVAEADSGEEACRECARVRPDVVVMDLSMPGMGGIEAVRRLLAQDPRLRVLALSAHEDTAHARRVLDAGALGYLTKRSAPEALIDAVQTVARGERYLDAHTAQALAMAQVRRRGGAGRGAERARVLGVPAAGAGLERRADRRQPEPVARAPSAPTSTT